MSSTYEETEGLARVAALNKQENTNTRNAQLVNTANVNPQAQGLASLGTADHQNLGYSRVGNTNPQVQPEQIPQPKMIQQANGNFVPNPAYAQPDPVAAEHARLASERVRLAQARKELGLF